MKPEEIAALKALADAAMPEPWRYATRASPAPHIVSVHALRAEHMGEPVCELFPGKELTAAFIAASREGVPALIKHLERARELLKMHQNYSPEAWRATDAYLREAAER